MANGIPSVMSHTFSEVPKAKISRSSFDRSHGYKTTLDAGYLVPILVDEALPGDTFNVNLTGFARLATPIKPFMDNMYMETFFFAVPNRLLWDSWEDFMGNNANENGQPADENEYYLPTMTIPDNEPTAREQSIFDYMGLPINSDAQINFSSLPFRAYNLIFNEWFRDQNLQDPVPIHTGKDQDPIADYKLLRRGKRHDYFTSCLPWPQKGQPVSIPLQDYADVIGINPLNGVRTNPTFGSYNGALNYGTLEGTDTRAVATELSNTDGVPLFWNQTGLVADLANASATSINDLRVAFQLQKMMEKDARGGTRYTEVIHAHFGVTSPDARLQRPEYLGGGRTRVNVNPVEQTATTDSNVTPQGNLAAYATAALSNHGFTKSFVEHCTIIGLVNIRADLTYQEGMNRMWSRRGRYDFFWPSFQHIGEQEVYADEIYASSDNDQNPIFGYQERYADYRYFPSQITGKFRSNAPDSLDIWHLSQDFAGTPKLNADFIQDDPPIDRVIAIPSEPHMLLDCYFSMRCARPMPLYGVPGNIDRF